ncbi:hypothetical protein BJY04DRAFT_49708 [Aspergillus karnatakaensis]|uniref:uncharacterized protein n=1 Tax=Aspergillus karnatakaensis TaxID=1810916 RepID=UPI003CCE1E1A
MDTTDSNTDSTCDMLKKLQIDKPLVSSNTKLESLPNELLYSVSRYLTTPDTVCLSLASRTLKLVLYDSCRPKQLQREDRLATLNRISRDVPDLFCCWSCGKLHRSENINPPTSPPIIRFSTRPICLTDLKKPAKIRYRSLAINCHETFYDFQQCHLMLAMKRHYLGEKHGISLETLFCTEIVEFPEYTTLMSVEPRICHPDKETHPALVLQVQNWLLLHDTEPSHYIMPIFLRKLPICHHNNESPLLDLFRTVFRDQGGWGRAKTPISSDYRCRGCGINIQLDLRDCGPEGRAVVVTKWMDLGAGVDVDDPKWVRLVDATGVVRAKGGKPDDARQLYQSTMTADQLLDSDPTHRNFLYLLGREYRESMKRVWGTRNGRLVEVWRVPGESTGVAPDREEH